LPCSTGHTQACLLARQAIQPLCKGFLAALSQYGDNEYCRPSCVERRSSVYSLSVRHSVNSQNHTPFRRKRICRQRADGKVVLERLIQMARGEPFTPRPPILGGINGYAGGKSMDTS